MNSECYEGLQFIQIPVRRPRWRGCEKFVQERKSVSPV